MRRSVPCDLLAAAIVKRMAECCLTQAQLAERIGMPRATLAAILTRRRCFPAHYFERLCTTLNCTIAPVRRVRGRVGLHYVVDRALLRSDRSAIVTPGFGRVQA